MKKLMAVMLICVIGAGCNSNSHAPAVKEASVDELSQMNRDFAKALNEKNAEAAANLYAEDAVLLPPNEETVSGRANIQKYWQGALDAGVSDVSVSTLAASSHGDLGYEVGRYHLTSKKADGTSESESGKYIELLKRDSSGVWKSIYGIWNTDSTAAQ
ncbi:MAG: YybH family protein [Chitinophagales bacterium]